MAQMGHTSSALALEVYAKKMERSRDTGARMDALIRGADWSIGDPAAEHARSADDLSPRIRSREAKVAR
jgi:hypothetical protein